jgi:hypothetical protein
MAHIYAGIILFSILKRELKRILRNKEGQKIIAG